MWQCTFLGDTGSWVSSWDSGMAGGSIFLMSTFSCESSYDLPTWVSNKFIHLTYGPIIQQFILYEFLLFLFEQNSQNITLL